MTSRARSKEDLQLPHGVSEDTCGTKELVTKGKQVDQQALRMPKLIMWGKRERPDEQ